MAEEVIGIDLGGTQLRVARVRGSEILQLESAAVGELDNERKILDKLLELAERCRNGGTGGIGVGVPGAADTESGMVYEVQNLPGWEEVPLGSILQAHFSLPVRVNNDTNCFALGEYHYGKGRSFRSMVALNIGTGVAGGIMIDGRLYEGRNGGAGEFGTVPFKSSMLEHYCGGTFFDRQYKTSGSEMAEKAARGDLRARAAFNEYGRYLGFAIKMILYNYDPEAIILGGSVSRSWPWFRESMMEEVGDFSYRKVLENLTIDVSETEHVALLGAALLPGRER